MDRSTNGLLAAPSIRAGRPGHIAEPLSLPVTPVRVVLITGNVRSGSTLLDTILGNHGEIESVGELCNVSENGWIPDRRCACGEKATDCPFWSEVRRLWARMTGTDDQRGYAALVRGLEKHRVWLPRLVAEIRRRTPRFLEYARRTRALYRAIIAVSGKPIVVDSSKRASRALLLAGTAGIDLRVIHLVRDCRGVAWSEKKQKFRKDENATMRLVEPGKSVGYTAMVWNAGNLQSAWIRRRLPPSKSTLVRYEDCAARPDDVLADVGRVIDLDLGPLAGEILAGQPLSVGHTIAGNAMRMRGPVRLRGDTEWIEKMSLGQRRVCWALSGWLMKQYGYRKDPAQRPSLPAAEPFPARNEQPPENAGGADPAASKEVAA